MKVLFISYWSVDEPLTSSTIVPYLRLMAAHPNITEVTLVTVERGGSGRLAALDEIAGVQHLPVKTRWKWAGPLSKADLFIRMIFMLVKRVKRDRVDLMDAKASIAGAIAHLVGLFTGVPYMVESFEPHSAYMVGCGVWSKRGMYFWISHWLEQAQKRKAKLLVTVTWNYRAQLMEEGVPADRIKVIPSIVDTGRFAFDPAERERIRASLGWTMEAPVGIYVGKFGGLYYDQEAFEIFKKAFDLFGPNFRLIILSIEPHESILRRLSDVGVPCEHVHVRTATHDDVPKWLSASDLAFSTIRYMEVGLYQSPVKNGEYWANGLPILLTDKVSDDHRVIREEPWAGALFDPKKEGSVDDALRHMHALFTEGVQRERIMALSLKHRSIHIAEEVYGMIFGAGPGFGRDSKNARKAARGIPRFR